MRGRLASPALQPPSLEPAHITITLRSSFSALRLHPRTCKSHVCPARRRRRCRGCATAIRRLAASFFLLLLFFRYSCYPFHASVWVGDWCSSFAQCLPSANPPHTKSRKWLQVHFLKGTVAQKWWANDGDDVGDEGASPGMSALHAGTLKWNLQITHPLLFFYSQIIKFYLSYMEF